MRNSHSSSASSGIGLFGVLGIIFVVLKLLHVIDWSWWLVTLPFWGGAAVIAVIGLVVLAVYAFAKAITKSKF